MLRKMLKNWSLQFNTFNFWMMEQYWNNNRLKRWNYDNWYLLFCYVKVLPLHKIYSLNCSSKLCCEACFFFLNSSNREPALHEQVKSKTSFLALHIFYVIKAIFSSYFIKSHNFKAEAFCMIWSGVLLVAFFKKSQYLSCLYSSIFILFQKGGLLELFGPNFTF